MKKIIKFILLLFFIPGIVFGHPIEDFAEVSASYIGTCIGINYLRQTQCPKLSSVDNQECINQANNLVHPKYKSIFRVELDKQIPIIKRDIPPYIAKGFDKTEQIYKNKDSACIFYGASLLTMKSEKLGELKRISNSWIQNEK